MTDQNETGPPPLTEIPKDLPPYVEDKDGEEVTVKKEFLERLEKVVNHLSSSLTIRDVHVTYLRERFGVPEDEDTLTPAFEMFKNAQTLKAMENTPIRLGDAPKVRPTKFPPPPDYSKK